MPPKAIFPRQDRPSGLEFACCKECNASTSASDAAAAFFARIAPDTQSNVPELTEAKKYLGSMTSLAPGFVLEVMDDRRAQHVWAKGRDSFYSIKRSIRLDGPVTVALMRAFSAKLGMALYREHVGSPLPEGGAVFSQHFFNSGLSQQEADATLSILPTGSELKQGRKSSGRLFNYRYNTDERTIVAALVAFNDNFFVRFFATHDAKLHELLAENHDLPPVLVGQFPELSKIWMPPKPAE